jgi:hypothetical protein
MIWHHIVVWFGHLEGTDIEFIFASLCFTWGLSDWNGWYERWADDRATG